MIPSIAADGSTQLALYFRVNSNGIPISFVFTDSEGEPYSFIYDDFQLLVKRNIGDFKNQIVLGFGSGLSLVDGVLTAQFTQETSKIKPGEYFWMLYKNDYGRPWITGPCYAIEGNLPVLESVEPFTINEGGYTINVSITEGGSGGGGISTVVTDNVTIQGDGSAGNPVKIKDGYLGSAALQPTSAFDAAGSAASVQANLTSHVNDTSNPHGVTKAQVGLSNVDNTSDANKPVSTATQTALDLKAPLASPTFTGNPTAPTQTAGDNSTKIATTAYADTLKNQLSIGGMGLT